VPIDKAIELFKASKEAESLVPSIRALLVLNSFEISGSFGLNCLRCDVTTVRGQDPFDDVITACEKCRWKIPCFFF